MNKILVIGSLNIDLATDIEVFAKSGETILGGPLEINCGGKGNNQAVAAAKLGANVSIMGAIGADNFGKMIIDNLKQYHIDIDYLLIRKNMPTATALIARTPQDNRIIVTQGANNSLSPEDIIYAAKFIAKHDIILLQQEIQLETEIKAIELAYDLNKIIIVNPAPKRVLPKDILRKITFLLPNEHEIFSFAQPKSQNYAEIILSSPIPIIMTWGKKGVLYKKAAHQLKHLPAYSVPVVDTTGAGDTFCGAFCAFYHLGIEVAIQKALQASALSVTHLGAQGGMPTLEKLNSFPLFKE